jgi:hypothetical protein
MIENSVTTVENTKNTRPGIRNAYAANVLELKFPEKTVLWLAEAILSESQWRF